MSELDSIVNDIISDNFGSKMPEMAPRVPKTAEPGVQPMPRSVANNTAQSINNTTPQQGFGASSGASGFSNPSGFSATSQPQAVSNMPAMGTRPANHNSAPQNDDATMIKEKMAEARQQLPNQFGLGPMDGPAPKKDSGLNKGILALIIAIPILVAGGGIGVAMLISSSNSGSAQTSQTQPTVKVTEVDLAKQAEDLIIEEAGIYELSGEMTYSVVVNADDEVTLVLNGATITAPEVELTEENVADGETPAEGEEPAEAPEAPAEQPAEGEAPAEGEQPAEVPEGEVPSTQRIAIRNLSENALIIETGDGTENTVNGDIVSAGALTFEGNTGSLAINGVIEGEYKIAGGKVQVNSEGAEEPEKPEGEEPAEGDTPPEKPEGEEGENPGTEIPGGEPSNGEIPEPQ